MQTFLPYPSFAQSVRVLDRARLGKQRLENVQILRAITVPGAGYASHSATRMWRKNLHSLMLYHEAVIHEWVDVRGYKDKQWEKFHGILDDHLALFPEDGRNEDEPFWIGDPEFHRSHQSNLLRKAHTMTDDQMRRLGIGRDYYDQFFPDVPDDLEYVWPVPKEE